VDTARSTRKTMKIHKAFSIDGNPVCGTFGARTLEDLRVAGEAAMNMVFGPRSFLDASTPEGRFCFESGMKVTCSIAGHIHGRPRLSRPIGPGETEIPISNGKPLPGPAIVQVDDELIAYEDATPEGLLRCSRGCDDTEPSSHELSTILFWPQPLREEIAAIKDSPNLWGYWVLDDTPGYALSAMRALYGTLKDVDDGGHAVVGGYSGATTLRNFGPGTCDMMAFYYYPLFRDYYDRSMNSYDTQWILTDARRRVPGIPFMGIYQAFWEPEGSLRGVNKLGPLTPREVREQTEDFVREGASAIVGFAMLGSGSRDFRGWESNGPLRQELKAINEEIRETGGIRIHREPRYMARARIQPRGFYRLPRDVPGMVPAFHVIGPFDAEGGSLDTAFPPDRRVDLEESYQGKGMEVAWRMYRAHSGTLGFVEIFGHPDFLKECTAYATFSFSVRRRTAAQIRFGSDDDGLIRLNAKEVWRFIGYRGVHFDSDVIPVNLDKGENRILVKVFNREGPWGFLLRFTDPEGRPLEGLTFSP
jgi:hypothetical protein